jgi:hypothetical protein
MSQAQRSKVLTHQELPPPPPAPPPTATPPPLPPPGADEAMLEVEQWVTNIGA